MVINLDLKAELNPSLLYEKKGIGGILQLWNTCCVTNITDPGAGTDGV